MIEVDTRELRALRRDAVELIVSALPLFALVGGANGREVARVCDTLGHPGRRTSPPGGGGGG